MIAYLHFTQSSDVNQTIAYLHFTPSSDVNQTVPRVNKREEEIG